MVERKALQEVPNERSVESEIRYVSKASQRSKGIGGKSAVRPSPSGRAENVPVVGNSDSKPTEYGLEASAISKVTRAALAIANERKEILNNLRVALEKGETACVLALARKLCGLKAND